MKKHAAHSRAWETAETVVGISIFLSLALGYLIPLPLSIWVPRVVSIWAGIGLLLIGIGLIGVTRRQFRQVGQPTDPGMPTTRLLTTGIFSWSRNPLYLAGLILFTGLVALFNSTWGLIFLIPTILAFHWILIVPEEQYLEAKFGETYRLYRRSVRRWMGRRT